MQADLWSVGAILYQLVIGRPPFDGNNQYQVLRRNNQYFLLVNSHVSFFFSYHHFLFQLFRNILASTELNFPPEALEELHSDCLDLCRNLLRQNPGIHCNLMS